MCFIVNNPSSFRIINTGQVWKNKIMSTIVYKEVEIINGSGVYKSPVNAIHTVGLYDRVAIELYSLIKTTFIYFIQL